MPNHLDSYELYKHHRVFIETSSAMGMLSKTSSESIHANASPFTKVPSTRPQVQGPRTTSERPLIKLTEMGMASAMSIAILRIGPSSASSILKGRDRLPRCRVQMANKPRQTAEPSARVARYWHSSSDDTWRWSPRASRRIPSRTRACWSRCQSTKSTD